MRRSFTLVLAALCILTPFSSPAHSHISDGSELPAKFRKVTNPIHGRYIVVLEDRVARSRVPSLAAELTQAYGGGILYVYGYVLKGFAVELPEAAAIALSRNPQVKYVEEDHGFTLTGSHATPQHSSFYGIDRIDQRSGLSGTYNYNRVGTGVHVYVLDTGIRTTHEEFGNRADVFRDYIGGPIVRNHGTFVAGLIGAKNYGVAKNAQIHSVRVCKEFQDPSGDCPATATINGLDQVAQFGSRPAVVNMSFGHRAGPNAPRTTTEDAVLRTIAAGVTVVAGAGNGSEPASWFSPARLPEVITVGATDKFDNRSSYSNYGSALDLFAPGGEAVPGQYIPSPSAASDTDIDGLTGTSAASPHVAGVVAQYLQINPNASPASVAAAIIGNATIGVVINPGAGSPNRLLYSRFLPPGDNRADFDGDYRTDVSIFNYNNGLWSSLNSSNGQVVSFGFGQSGDIITPGDYNGDGKTDRAVFRPGNATWYIATDTIGGYYGVSFGQSGDIPVARDYDADGKTDIAVFRPGAGTWYILNSRNNTASIVSFGQSGDHVVPGDYDGDDKADIAVFRPSNTLWYILRSSDGAISIDSFGAGTDWPVQADYDGDGKTDIAIFRPSAAQWWIKYSFNGVVQSLNWGTSGDRPVPGDYDGDGKADVAVQRPDASGTWWISNSTGGYNTVSFSSEFPIPGGYLTPLY